MAVDLHTHSTASDGSDPPERIVELAAERRLTAVALMDHDTLEGIPAARRAAEAIGMPLIPGIELSVLWPTGTMHMLAYFLEPGPGPLQDRLAALRDGREARNVLIVEALNGLDIEITIEEVEKESGGGSIGRPHIAAILVRKGAAHSMADAFDRYLADGRPAYRPRLRLEAAEAAALTSASGGVAVVAHPHTVAGRTEGFAEAFAAFKDIGVSGIECHYSEYAPDNRRRLAAIAADFGLIATGGSDYHGTYKPGLELGTGRGDLAVPDAAYEALLAARPR
ncbi:MAG: PHP domain-containing protein [Acidimicrobiia bacterium]|nr:PHP domain-containing protein [Acidimicrobiia bacterium]